MNPSVSINGTSREELVDQRINAANAVNIALGQLRMMQPHRRDYVGKDHQYSLDLKLHLERCAELEKLASELVNEGLAIQEGGR